MLFLTIHLNIKCYMQIYTIHLNIKCYLQMYAILFASLFVLHVFCPALLKPGFHQDIYAF